MRYCDKCCKPLFVLVLCAMLMLSPITAFAVNSPLAVDGTDSSLAVDETDSSVAEDEADSSVATDGTGFPVAVDEINFPDAEWRNYVNIFIAGGDNVLTQAEADSVTFINVAYHRVTNLSGVEYFANLSSLNCSHNALTSLNVTGLENLKILKCSYNALTSLNVVGLENLQEFYCGSNALTSLNIAGLNNLKSFYCTGNSLTSLDVSGLENLKILNCSYNALTSLNVAGLENLQEFHCDSNSLTSLDVSGLENLEEISCSRNALASFDVVGLKKLRILRCSENSLTSLDVSGLANLQVLNCYMNALLDIVGESNAAIAANFQTRTISMISDGEGKYVSTDTYPLQKTSHLRGLSPGVTYDAETSLFLADTVPITSPFSTLIQSDRSLVSGTLSFSHTDSVLVSPSASDVYKGRTQQFTAAVDIVDDIEKKVIWSVIGGTDSTIDSNGLLLVGMNETAATLTITATSVFNSGIFGTATVTVSSEWAEYPVLEGFSVFTGSGDDSATIGASASKFLHLLVDGIKLDPSNYTITGESSTIITLKESYLNTLPNGNHRVVAMFTDGQSETNLVVDAPIKVTGITLNKATASVVVGNTVQLTATILPDNATDKGVTWKSSNTSIATVDTNGLVKGIGVGKVAITVTANDGGYTATCEVTVTSNEIPYPVLEGFSVFTGSGDDSATIGASASKFLHLLVDGIKLDPSNYTITGESSTIITLKESYLNTLPNGNHRVVAMFTDGQSETNLVVDAPIKVTGITLNKTTASVVVGNTVQLTVTIFPDNATGKGVTWKSSATSIATVNANGLVKGAGVGKVTITVTANDGGYTATCEVTVGGSDDGGTPAPIPVYYTIDFYNGGTLHARRSTNEGNALKTGWPENPVKTGYTFGGWYTGQNGTGTKYTPDSAIFSNLTLYAKWTSNSGGSASSSGSSSSSATSSSQQTTSTCTEPESKSETSESAVTSNTSRSEENNPQTNDSETPPALWLCILIPAVLVAAGATVIIIWRRRRNEEK